MGKGREASIKPSGASPANASRAPGSRISHANESCVPHAAVELESVRLGKRLLVLAGVTAAFAGGSGTRERERCSGGNTILTLPAGSPRGSSADGNARSRLDHGKRPCDPASVLLSPVSPWLFLVSFAEFEIDHKSLVRFVHADTATVFSQGIPHEIYTLSERETESRIKSWKVHRINLLINEGISFMFPRTMPSCMSISVPTS